ncbi:hypothetical protein FANTH_3449 [Fusarium anthophilum]|uniref:Uncharacterized protein n=1 Tax=Fusarium anthophilum TaxID=48485 RepID=A0A8H4ZRI3_9HYPO|nr:hypothetical protein FANTH_3449 [Fusarium anthophilum]
MLFTPLILLLPAISYASWSPIKRGQPSNPEDCIVISTLSPIIMTSLHPTSTFGPNGPGSGSGSGSGDANDSGGLIHGQVTDYGSLVYTTALPTLGPNGLGIYTYTITAPCASDYCQRPASNECPPGFITTTVICHVCGVHPVTTTLTLPIESATAAQRSRDGPEMPGAQKTSQVPGGSDSEHDGAGKGDELPDGPKNTGAPGSPTGADASTHTKTVDTPGGASSTAGNEAGHGDGIKAGSKSASPSDDANPSAVVVTGHAPQTKVPKSVILKVALFATIVLYSLHV